MADPVDKTSDAVIHGDGQFQRAEPGPDATQDEIVADIEDTREELRRTVDSLSGKLDVKSNAKAQVDRAKQSVATSASGVRNGAVDVYNRALSSRPVRQVRARPAVPAAIGGTVVVIIGSVVVLRRRGGHRSVRLPASRSTPQRRRLL